MWDAVLSYTVLLYISTNVTHFYITESWNSHHMVCIMLSQFKITLPYSDSALGDQSQQNELTSESTASAEPTQTKETLQNKLKLLNHQSMQNELKILNHQRLQRQLKLRNHQILHNRLKRRKNSKKGNKLFATKLTSPKINGCFESLWRGSTLN
jgi:hypothetical protein